MEWFVSHSSTSCIYMPLLICHLLSIARKIINLSLFLIMNFIVLVYSAAMVTVTKEMCWTVVAKTLDSSGIGLVIYQKPTSSSCYEKRKQNKPPICKNNESKQISWYMPVFWSRLC